MALDRLGEAVGRFLGVFYCYDGMFESINPEYMQHLINFLVGLF